ncbi:unnamed protein product, partial [Symbiodinium pilosum]
VSAIMPSASALDLRRKRLEKLLTKATPGPSRVASTPAFSEASRLSRRAPPGGAPYQGAPPVRILTTESRHSNKKLLEDSRLCSAGTDAMRSAQLLPSPSSASRKPTASSRLETSSSRKVNPERIGSLVRQLLAGEEPAANWRLVHEVDAIDGLLQECWLASRWQEEERLKKAQQQEALRKFNEEQARHAEAGRQRKRAEASVVAQLEEDMAKQAAEAKLRQEEAEERKKRQQQEMAKQMAEAAKQAVEQKALQKQEEAQKDIALMHAQIALMEDQEKRRADALQKIRDKQGKAQAQYEAGAGSQLAKLQQEEDERARRYQEEKNAKDEAAFKEKQSRLKKMHMDGAAFLSKQVAEQACQKAAEREEQRRRREHSDRDAAAALEEEKLQVLQRKQREKENAAFLQQQMSQKFAAKMANDDMTQVEQSMNKERLERAKRLMQNQLRDGMPVST